MAVVKLKNERIAADWRILLLVGLYRIVKKALRRPEIGSTKRSHGFNRSACCRSLELGRVENLAASPADHGGQRCRRVDWLMKVTEPSQRRTLTPPVWKL